MAGLVLNSTAVLRLNFWTKLAICASISPPSPSAKPLFPHSHLADKPFKKLLTNNQNRFSSNLKRFFSFKEIVSLH
jgi:hypothetical protein